MDLKCKGMFFLIFQDERGCDISQQCSVCLDIKIFSTIVQTSCGSSVAEHDTDSRML